jgi:hypothetical protein
LVSEQRMRMPAPPATPPPGPPAWAKVRVHQAPPCIATCSAGGLGGQLLSMVRHVYAYGREMSRNVVWWGVGIPGVEMASTEGSTS